MWSHYMKYNFYYHYTFGIFQIKYVSSSSSYRCVYYMHGQKIESVWRYTNEKKKKFRFWMWQKCKKNYYITQKCEGKNL